MMTVKTSKSEHDRAGPSVGVNFGEFAFRVFTRARRSSNTTSFFYTFIFSKRTLTADAYSRTLIRENSDLLNIPFA
jgi:hypothetical protein